MVCRWAEQTSKGMMWRDIGLSAWLFDVADGGRERIVPAVLAPTKRSHQIHGIPNTRPIRTKGAGVELRHRDVRWHHRVVSSLGGHRPERSDAARGCLSRRRAELV